MFKEADPDASVPFEIESKEVDKTTVAESLGATPEKIAAMSPDAVANKKQSLVSAEKISGAIGETVKNNSALRNIATSGWFLPAVSVIAALATMYLRGGVDDLISQADASILESHNYVPEGGVFASFDDPIYGANAKDYYLGEPGMRDLYEKAQLMGDASIGTAIISLLSGGGAIARRFMKKRNE